MSKEYAQCLLHSATFIKYLKLIASMGALSPLFMAGDKGL